MTPDIYTISETYLDVGNGHRLYVQDWGNASAKTPIIALHGGPGSQSRDKHKNMFNPAKQRVIFFDQRGSGNSTPHGSLEHNTTQDLTEDIEKIAQHLQLTDFVLVGGSWGCCLALVYALKYPKRVTALVLNGIFTGSSKEIAWVDQGTFATFFPDVWQAYLDATPKKHHRNPSAYHFTRILGKDEKATKESAYIYEALEGSLIALDDRYAPNNFVDYDPAGMRIEVHYIANRVFLPDRYILDNAHKLKMPIWLVQGRYDVVCPPSTAYELDRELANSQLIWTINGHKADHESWNIQRNILSQWS